VHDAFWSERTGQLLDPFGHRWALDEHVRDVPHDEIHAAGAAPSGLDLDDAAPRISS
jgi:PhnB protein